MSSVELGSSNLSWDGWGLSMGGQILSWKARATKSDFRVRNESFVTKSMFWVTKQTSFELWNVNFNMGWWAVIYYIFTLQNRLQNLLSLD